MQLSSPVVRVSCGPCDAHVRLQHLGDLLHGSGLRISTLARDQPQPLQHYLHIRLDLEHNISNISHMHANLAEPHTPPTHQ